MALVEAERHGVDSEVAPVEVFVECAVFGDRFAAVVIVALAPGSYEFHLYLLPAQLCGAEVAVDGYVAFADFGFQSFGQDDAGSLYAASHHYYVDVLRWAVEEEVAHPSAYDVGFELQFVGCLAYEVKYGVVECLA